MTSKSILVSKLTHSSLFLLQAKLMTSDKKKYSMNEIIDRLLTDYDNLHYALPPHLSAFKLKNIET